MKELINKFAQAHKESSLATKTANYSDLSNMVYKIVKSKEKALDGVQKTIKSFIKKSYSDDEVRMAFNFQACLDYILFIQGKPNKATFM